jgi:hypothetical protein
VTPQQICIILDNIHDFFPLISRNFQIFTIINKILILQYVHTCLTNSLFLCGDLSLSSESSTLEVPTMLDPVEILPNHILSNE